jgi:hypothetical protein
LSLEAQTSESLQRFNRYLILLIVSLGAIHLQASSALASAERPSDGKALLTMSADAWTMEPPIPSLGGEAGAAKFARYEGMPTGTMTLNEGVAASKTVRFSTGAIDFDIKPIGYNDAGVIFHREGSAEGEFVYVRANPDCPAANDCIQYAPVAHTMMGWNIYPNYQGPAPISPTGWNHIHIEVIGDGMRVYVNHAQAPSLVVPRLWGLTHDGGLAFKGPAVYANLIVDSYASAGLPVVPAASVEPGTVMAWSVAPPTAYDRSGTVLAKDAPASDAWHPIEVEPTGLVNLGRAFGLAHAPSPSLAWLKSEVTAAAPVSRTLQVGFAEEVWVFLNGQLVYSGSNQYFPPESRLSPDGRLEPDNASIPLQLREGRNEIIFAVGNNWRTHKGLFKPSPYGWAAEDVHWRSICSAAKCCAASRSRW